ncbi:MAG TPA: PDZ domain-containing protein [Thermoanaerobaculia bacterium]|nr:PDZ domain-containing protein [Thermoanaerobaculia bacterium]
MTIASAESRAAPQRPTPEPIAYLGIEFRWHIDASTDRALHVARVAPNGPAARAGIQPGDLITRVAGVRVDFGDELDFLMFMRKRRAGEQLRLTVVRSGTSTDRVVILGALPAAARARWQQNLRMAEERRAAAKTARRR